MSWLDYIPGAGIPGVGNWTDLIDPIKNGIGGAFSSAPSAYQDRGQIQDLINKGFGRANQTIGGGPDPFRQGQLQQVQQLQGIASGQQQGAGELASQRQVANAQAAQQAAARMARGGNAALAFRNAANNQAGLGLAGAGQAQQAALQDQQNAMGQLTGALGQGRQGDLGAQNNQLQQQQINNQMYQQMLQQLSGMNANELQARINAHGQQQQLVGGLLSGAGQMGAQAAMMSDERNKTDIADAKDDIDEMLDKVFPRAYVYKEPKRWGEGRRFGIMAQDLESSTAGREIIRETPAGKMLDKDAMLSAAFAGIARLNHRLRDLEGER